MKREVRLIGFGVSVSAITIIIILLIPCYPAFARPPLSPTEERITSIIVEEILHGRTEGVRVVTSPLLPADGSAELLWSGGTVVAPATTAYLAVVDDETPGVIGFHPVLHVYLDGNLAILEVRRETFYPRIYVGGKRLRYSTLIAYRPEHGRPSPHRELVPSPDGTEGSRGEFTYDDYYAVIIEGDVPYGPEIYASFWIDTVRLFRILLESGYLDDHIHVLYGEGADESDWPCEFYREEMVDFPAYLQNVRDIFTWMKDGNAPQGIPQVTDQDFIFLFTGDHGNRSEGCEATLVLMDGEMTDTEFADYFNAISYKHRAVFMQQCFSGGFVDNLENATSVVATASDCHEPAFEGDERDPCGAYEVSYGEWDYWWMSAMERHKPWPTEEPVDADANTDGLVSFLEAFNYALANDSADEHPQWSDPGGIGDSIGLSTSYNGVRLVHRSHAVDDAAGNGDGAVDAGEPIVMPVTLGNVGTLDGTGVAATLSTTSPWVTVTDDSASFPDMTAGGGSGESYPDHYAWSSSADTPDDTRVRFSLDWSAGGGYSGTTTFHETVGRVILEYHARFIDDAEGGDGDSLAEAGESILLAVTLRNAGHRTARQVTGSLSTTSPYATVTDADSEFPDIPGQATGTSIEPHFGLQIDGAAPHGTPIELTLDMTADGYSVSLPLTIHIGARGTLLLVEDGDPADATVLESLIADLGFLITRQTASATDPGTWSGYGILLWCAGDNPSPVDQSSWRDELEQYVDGGGKLLIEGGDLGYAHQGNDSFKTRVLRMNYWTERCSGNLRREDADHPLATIPWTLPDEIESTAATGPERDSVTPDPFAHTIMSWTGAMFYGSLVAYDRDNLEGNGGQTVSLFTAADTISETGDQRRNLVDNILTWLLGSGGPYLVYHAHSIQDIGTGNGDAAPDPGETVAIPITLANRGSEPATGIWGRATSDLPDQVFFLDNYLSWPDIDHSIPRQSDDPHLVVRLAEEIPCGTVVRITLHLTTAEGRAFDRSFSFEVGRLADRITYPSTDTPKTFPDYGTDESIIDVTDSYPISDIFCSVRLNHYYTYTVEMKLASPSGTEVTLHRYRDSGTAIHTTYDDRTQPDGPGSMADLDGEDVQGEWRLIITDSQPEMLTPMLDSWDLLVHPPNLCNPWTCSDPIPGEVGDSLRMARTTGSDVHLEWGAVAGAGGYNVWRSASGEFTDPETSGHSDTTTLEETGLPNNEMIYYYQVRAENLCREEGP